MKKTFQMILASIFLLGCALPSFLSPTQKANNTDCASITITDNDVNSTLQYGENYFSHGDWKRSYTVNKDQVFVSHISDPLNAVAFVDTLILCNSKVTLKSYASKENIAIMLSNYEKYTQTNSCEKDGTLLFQLIANNQGGEYNVNLWLTPLKDPNRAMEIMLVFPTKDPKKLAEYSQTFFPELTSCK